MSFHVFLKKTLDKNVLIRGERKYSPWLDLVNLVSAKMDSQPSLTSKTDLRFHIFVMENYLQLKNMSKS